MTTAAEQQAIDDKKAAEFAASRRIDNKQSAEIRADSKSLIVHGDSATGGTVLTRVYRQRRGEDYPKDLPSCPNEFVVDLASKPGARLLLEVTFQHSAKTCPKCGHGAIAPLGNVPAGAITPATEYRCAQCGTQFTLDGQPESSVYVLGVTDDANDVYQESPLTEAEEKNKAVQHEAYEARAAKAKADGVAIEPEPEFVRTPVRNEWKRVAQVEIDPGMHTELWAALASKPVTEIKISMNHPDSFERPTSVSAMATELLAVEPEVDESVARPSA
jgi:transposase-like protein